MSGAKLPLRRQLRRPGSPRSARHVVRVTAEQEQRLIERAAAGRVTVSRLLVEAALGDPAASGRGVVVDPVSREVAGELFGVNRVLGRVSVNVNQIAKATNATGELQASTVSTLDAIGRVCGRLQEVLDVIDPGGRR